MKTIKVKRWKEIPENFTGVVEFPRRTKWWFKEGKEHREDGPAREYIDGDKEWWLEGKFYYLKNIRDYVVLDSYQGKYGIMWYKLLKKDKIVDYPDIPGLITK
jgi:hypothetical protein